MNPNCAGCGEDVCPPGGRRLEAAVDSFKEMSYGKRHLAVISCAKNVDCLKAIGTPNPDPMNPGEIRCPTCDNGTCVQVTPCNQPQNPCCAFVGNSADLNVNCNNGCGSNDICFSVDPDSESENDKCTASRCDGVINNPDDLEDCLFGSQSPSAVPSAEPTGGPSALPSGVPSAKPSVEPTGASSATPSAVPSGEPSGVPSAEPSGPTDSPTFPVPTPPPTAGIETCVAKLVDPCSDTVIGFCQETRTYQPTFKDYGGANYDFSTISGTYTLKTEEHAVTFSYFYADNPISNDDKSLHYIDGIVNGGNTVHSGFTMTLDPNPINTIQVIYLCENAKVKDEECGLPKFPKPSESPSAEPTYEGFVGDDDDDDDCSEEPSSAPTGTCLAELFMDNTYFGSDGTYCYKVVIGTGGMYIQDFPAAAGPNVDCSQVTFNDDDILVGMFDTFNLDQASYTEGEDCDTIGGKRSGTVFFYSDSTLEVATVEFSEPSTCFYEAVVTVPECPSA
jgi:hypothetical protein